MLEVDGLSAWYGATKVLFDVSFAVEPGSTVAIAGTNGAGKTTLLKSLLGLVRSRGRVCWEGARLDGRATHRRVKQGGVSVVHEGRGLITSLSVEDNLTLGLRTVDRDRLGSVYDTFPRLHARGRHRVTDLSGGEQQMVALGRTMMRDTRLLLIDEPSLGLAPAIVEQMYAAITRLCSSGATVLLVEQEVRLACEVADRVLILRSGSVVGDLSGSDKSFQRIVDMATGASEVQ
jgi:branched-chain amino acid transport system ATP-binding protein